MSTPPDALPEALTANLNLAVGGWKLQTSINVPTGPIQARQLIPLAQVLASRVADAVAEQSRQQGQPISCQKGCGACCRQLVPIAQSEARAIRELVKALPEPRRSQIRARFAEARRRLEQAGMFDDLLDHVRVADGALQALGLRYFELGIPCPFLEDESCSIHPDRPVSCREYLVTSPAENCAHPSPETVHCLEMPLKVWAALAQMDGRSQGSRLQHWVPLSVAPEWAETHPDEPPPRPGPELVGEFVQHLTGKSVPPPP